MKAILPFALLICFTAKAQNLVPNPSFEDTVQCPWTGGQVDQAEHWYVAENTPDYFNVCCTLDAFSVPANTLGTRYPASGNAYCGFCTYSTLDQYREKLGVHLTQPLIINIKYYVSFKVSPSLIHSQGINGTSNKTGALFSTVQYTGIDTPYSNFCQVWTDSIISDTTSWTTIKGSFIADSAYTYMTIGNLFDNIHTDTLSMWHIPASAPNTLQCYYYIDDVCVTADSAGCAFGTGLNNTEYPELHVFPNPVDDILRFSANHLFEQGILYNSFGQIALEINPLNTEINIAGFPAGTYTLVLLSKKSIIAKKITILHN